MPEYDTPDEAYEAARRGGPPGVALQTLAEDYALLARLPFPTSTWCAARRLADSPTRLRAFVGFRRPSRESLPVREYA